MAKKFNSRERLLHFGKFIIIIAIVLAIPLTVIQVQQKQNAKSNAAEIIYEEVDEDLQTSVESTSFDVPYAELSKTTLPISISSTDNIFVGAGDICIDKNIGSAKATGNLIRRIIEKNPNAAVFTAGDNAYTTGTTEEFTNCFNRVWGSFKSKIKPSLGNHDYGRKGNKTFKQSIADNEYKRKAVPYFSYFGEGVAGVKGKGWYSYDLPNNWHVIVLNSNCKELDYDFSTVDSCGPNSEQGTWLKADLENNKNKNKIAIWHDPYYAEHSGRFLMRDSVKSFWKLLVNAKTDIVINGHNHYYERFSKLNFNGEPDPFGIRQFTVGSGGFGHLTTANSVPGLSGALEDKNDKHHGILVLKLGLTSYAWQWITAPNDSNPSVIKDQGSGRTNNFYIPKSY